jgi:hypothetical protein
MLIKAITLENFKGIHKPARIEFKPITLLFGPNSAGKSTILQALVYMREILERHNLDPDRTLLGGEWMNLGGFRNLVHNHDLDNEVVIGFELDISDTDLPNYLLEGESWLLESAEGGGRFADDWLSRINNISFKIHIKWSDLLDRPIVKNVVTHTNGNLISRVSASDDAKAIAIDFLDITDPIFWDEGETEYNPEGIWFENLMTDAFYSETILFPDVNVIITGQRDALPAPDRKLEFDRDIWESGYGTFANHPLAFGLLIKSLLSGLIVGPIDLLRRELDKLIYIGPLREVPDRHMTYQRSPDISRWARGEAAWDHLHTCDSAFYDKVNDWIAVDERFGTGYRIERKQYKELDILGPEMLALMEGRVLDEEDTTIKRIENLPTQTRVYLVDERSGVHVEPQDVGVGISQLLPVIVATILARSGVIAVEQPELHIHPAWQVVLGDLFMSQTGEKQMLHLIETHSEHLVLRIMRRMRETFTNELPPGAHPTTPNDIAIYYVENDEGQTIIREMPLNETGDLVKAWPGGFFEERFPELL